MSNELIAILGGVITFLLGVNAWYFKGMLSGIQKIEIRLEKVITEKDYMDRMLLNHDDEIKSLREEVHKLKGGQSQVLDYLSKEDEA